MMNINEMVARVMEILDNTDYEFVGIRTCDDEYSVGDTCANSYVWVDGEWTEDELDGTCASQLSWRWDEDRIRKTLVLHCPECIAENDNRWFDRGAYVADHTYIIGGDHAEYGVDPDEVIIRDAEVIEVLR